MPETDQLKRLTARSVKWNLIDRVGSMILYLIIGIILARQLTPGEFGLVATVLAFQAFASLFIDSGFSYALIQRHEVTRSEYSSVLWFNMAIAVAAYLLLWFASGLVARFYDAPSLVWLGRVVYISFLFNAASLVQQTRLMKQQNVAPIAAANTLGLVIGGAVAVWGAFNGWGAWAPVAQMVVLSAVKCAVLWIYTRWLPLIRFSWSELRSFMHVGMGMMLTSLLNTLFLQIYALVIGKAAGMSRLGFYNQAEKWSKMGIVSLSQTLTQAFLPTLAGVLKDKEHFSRAVTRMNRTGSYLVLPAMGLLIVMAEDIFHILFGSKWDPAIVLFRILLFRGVFYSLTQLYNNYIIALGLSRLVLKMEVLRDVIAGVALVACLPIIAVEHGGNMLWGIEILLWGQAAASFIAWIYMLRVAAPLCGHTSRSFLADSVLPLSATLAAMGAGYFASIFIVNPWLSLTVTAAVALSVYLLLNSRNMVQKDIFNYIRGNR